MSDFPRLGDLVGQTVTGPTIFPLITVTFKMQPLRPLSARPTVIDDPWGYMIIDPTTGARVGVPKPKGRMRLVAALNLNESDKGPLMVEPYLSVNDPWGYLLADPATGAVVGKPGLWCHRWTDTTWTEDTRRL